LISKQTLFALNANTVRLAFLFVKTYTVHMPFPAKTDPESILNAALEMLEQDGSLSMRNLATALTMKAPSLYRHYPDKAALETVLKMRGSELLRAALEKAILNHDPTQAMRKAANASLKFARAHPYLYDLMNAPGGTPSTGAAKDLWNTILEIVGNVTGKPNDTASSVAFWAFLHGFCSLERTGMFGTSGAKGGFEVGLEALMTGFSSGVKKRKLKP
jgi:AcrR family transcriptional regulator